MKNRFFSDNFNFGSFSFAPFVALVDREIFSQYEYVVANNNLHLFAKCKDFSDDLYIKKTDNGFSARRIFKNCSDKVLKLSELGVKFEGIDLGTEPSDDYYYHAENSRLFDKLILKVDSNRVADKKTDSEYDEVGGNKWCDPGVVTNRVGACPYQPFPAILFSNLSTKCGLVHGTLSQDVFYHCYLPYHKDGKLCFDAYSSFKDISYRELCPSEALVDMWYLGETDRANDIEHIFDKYSSELRKILCANYGASNINRDNLVWGSWNDGIYRDVSEELLIEEGKALKKYFPKVEWLQLDDGYCTNQSKLGFRAHGLGVPYEGDAGIDPVKFPHGLKYVTDKIRELGLRPAIWIGGYCPKDMKISEERPDLMCEYKSRTDKCYVLDVSNPETRDYMTHALDVLITDYGFEGVKHDFWSYAFEVSEDLLANKNKSGYEYRDWWCKEVRKRLPGDAHFQTGCDIVMGNPFLGKYFSNYRYGIDIGGGNWNNFKTNYLWCMVCLATHTGDIFVPNSDAIGLFPELNDIDAAFATNFLIITRTMVELAGKYSKIDTENRRFKMVRKATCHINNGQDVFFADFDYRKEGTLPEALYLETPHFSNESPEFAPIRTLAVFNISDIDGVKRRVTRTALALPEGEYILTDIWSGEELRLTDSIEFTLDSHGSRLFSVNRLDKALILDSNTELSNMLYKDAIFTAELSYPYDCELTLAKQPKSVWLEDEEIPFEFSGKVLRFAAKCKGKLTLKF